MTQASPIRQFLRTSGLGRWGLAVTVLLILLAVSRAVDCSRKSLGAKLAGSICSRQARITGWGPMNSAATFCRAHCTARAFRSWLACRSCVGAGIVGLALGSLSGYFGGAFDRFINIVLINSFLSFPGILLAIAFAAFLGPGLDKVILALVITGWAGYARLARAQVLKVREMEFVLAARSLGASHARILLRHLLPNTLQPVFIQATIGMAGAILAESTLSFLGLGVVAPTPSWGAMLNDARNHLFDAPHLVVFPALGIMAAVLAFNLLGDALRDWLDPRTRAFLTTMDLTASRTGFSLSGFDLAWPGTNPTG